MSENPFTLVLLTTQIKKIWHMAKVSIKSEKLKRWQSYFGKEVDDESY